MALENKIACQFGAFLVEITLSIIAVKVLFKATTSNQEFVIL
jgi:hypothetical protein